MLLTTMIDPTKDVRTQVVATNVQTGGLPPLDISAYLTRQELARIGFLYDNAAEAEKSGILSDAASHLMTAVLIAEHDISEEFASQLVSIILSRPEARPEFILNDETIDHVRDYFRYAYDKVRIEIFVTSMEEYQAYHKIFVPVERIRFFPEETLLKRMQNSNAAPTMAEASAAFQLEPMTSFAIMYAMSTHQVFSTVPLPEFRAMMLPMSYNLWKQEILSPKDSATSEISVEKTMKPLLKDVVLR